MRTNDLYYVAHDQHVERLRFEGRAAPVVWAGAKFPTAELKRVFAELFRVRKVLVEVVYDIFRYLLVWEIIAANKTCTSVETG